MSIKIDLKYKIYVTVIDDLFTIVYGKFSEITPTTLWILALLPLVFNFKLIYF